VIVAVHANLVSSSSDLSQHLGRCQRLAAKYKERGMGTKTVQCRQNLAGRFGVGAIVEGQDHLGSRIGYAAKNRGEHGKPGNHHPSQNHGQVSRKHCQANPDWRDIKQHEGRRSGRYHHGCAEKEQPYP
jgi:hypothetical protein